MRTTVTIDDDLLASARERAAAERTTLSALVESALRAQLAPRAARDRGSAQLTTFRGNGLAPGIDLDDSAALRDMLDG